MQIANLTSNDIVNSVCIFIDIVVINSKFREYYWDEQCILQILVG